MLSHHGAEAVCALNDLCVFGKSAAEDLEDQLSSEPNIEEDHTENTLENFIEPIAPQALEVKIQEPRSAEFAEVGSEHEKNPVERLESEQNSEPKQEAKISVSSAEHQIEAPDPSTADDSTSTGKFPQVILEYLCLCQCFVCLKMLRQMRAITEPAEKNC